ncbi:hypothetical protein [Dactylosporangium matsuzakiense]|uniref:hypothetical protein n=1 Tax=Dactylosporangium matsuzakiense TaxID=53360 RepID=UPI0021C3969C|nr:hypothetical protein [Dactylosporangium matsuzakiense]UWZ47054.1 hypothetical protein Dmats_12010 [Dactylosporangium matsuzakiense]
MKLLFEASAPVAAPVERVLALIDDGWVVTAFLGSEQRAYIDIDHRPGVVGFQGHWWYRGEISAEPAGEHGTTVVYRVYNIAARGAWAVPLANRLFIGWRRKVGDGATRLARQIEHHLS